MKPKFKAPLLFVVVAAVGFGMLYAPLLLLVQKSFLGTGAGTGTVAGEWTLAWYQKLFFNPALKEGLTNSLQIALVSSLVSTVLGTAAALFLHKFPIFPGRKFFDLLVHIPLVMPEIVMGISLLVWFVFLKITLGVVSIVLAHVTFSLSYVLMTVRSRLEGLDPTLEEAAKDLGATPIQVFTKVVFPLLLPGIASGAAMAFTLSFDDFLITFFTSGVGSDTLPLKIYSMVRMGVSPEINALSTLMMSLTLVFVLIFGKNHIRKTPN